MIFITIILVLLFSNGSSIKPLNPTVPRFSSVGYFTPEPTPSIEQRLKIVESEVEEIDKQLEQPRKDVWDKIDAVSGLVAGTVVVIISFIASSVYKKKELAISEADTIHKFMPDLRSTDERSKETALLALSVLGQTKISARLAELYSSEGSSGSVSALDKMVLNSDKEISQLARSSLESIGISSGLRIAVLLDSFDRKEVPGELFTTQGRILLPSFDTINLPETEIKFWYKLEAKSDDELWLVLVRVGLSSSAQIQQLSEIIRDQDAQPPDRVWVVIMSDVSDHLVNKLVQKGYLVSTIDDIDKLEGLVLRSLEEIQTHNPLIIE